MGYATAGKAKKLLGNMTPDGGCFGTISNHGQNFPWAEKTTVPAEQSLHLIPGLFGFDWVATVYKPGLIMSYKV